MKDLKEKTSKNLTLTVIGTRDPSNEDSRTDRESSIRLGTCLITSASIQVKDRLSETFATKSLLKTEI